MESNKSKHRRGIFRVEALQSLPANPAKSTTQVVCLSTHLASSPPSTSFTMAVGKVGAIASYERPRTQISLRTSVCPKERRV